MLHMLKHQYMFLLYHNAYFYSQGRFTTTAMLMLTAVKQLQTLIVQRTGASAISVISSLMISLHVLHLLKVCMMYDASLPKCFKIDKTH